MKLLLIDGHSLAFACSRIARRMATRSGEPTSTTSASLLHAARHLREQQPDYVAVAFDVGGRPPARVVDYKGTRERMPDDLRQQVARASRRSSRR